MRNIFLKKIFYIGFAGMLMFGFNNCTVKHTHHHKTVVVKKKRTPPGHAKKIHGNKSAKHHAPGHNK